METSLLLRRKCFSRNFSALSFCCLIVIISEVHAQYGGGYSGMGGGSYGGAYGGSSYGGSSGGSYGGSSGGYGGGYGGSYGGSYGQDDGYYTYASRPNSNGVYPTRNGLGYSTNDGYAAAAYLGGSSYGSTRNVASVFPSRPFYVGGIYFPPVWSYGFPGAPRIPFYGGGLGYGGFGGGGLAGGGGGYGGGYGGGSGYGR
ncbi:hypothetical protein RvY_05781 [Ramazzottius varieornatus]|uniref:Uncharacterized protein n=1 Tax=Ramazzottius varieornatus TaxID=947166 RepID=A0A1D1V5X5_RAMVA|nr:hypothetical protein RvY_05781 [Ramazzottius varieornatus]